MPAVYLVSACVPARVRRVLHPYHNLWSKSFSFLLFYRWQSRCPKRSSLPKATVSKRQGLWRKPGRPVSPVLCFTTIHTNSLSWFLPNEYWGFPSEPVFKWSLRHCLIGKQKMLSFLWVQINVIIFCLRRVFKQKRISSKTIKSDCCVCKKSLRLIVTPAVTSMERSQGSSH